ncbi:MAG: hypothetical protein KHX00_17895 [Bacteroides sp.]|nr:hypothetical protein [Bacteroides sp.]
MGSNAITTLDFKAAKGAIILLNNFSHTCARTNKVENNETWGEEGEHGEEDASTMTMKKCCQNIIILSPTLRLHFNL